MACGDDRVAARKESVPSIMSGLVYTNLASGGRHSHQQTNMTNFRTLDSVTLLITLWAAYLTRSSPRVAFTPVDSRIIAQFPVKFHFETLLIAYPSPSTTVMKSRYYTVRSSTGEAFDGLEWEEVAKAVENFGYPVRWM